MSHAKMYPLASHCALTNFAFLIDLSQLYQYNIFYTLFIMHECMIIFVFHFATYVRSVIVWDQNHILFDSNICIENVKRFHC